MSSLVADIVIVLLLFTGIVFGGISLLGLLIFPDIRSRMYTAIRAGLICAAAIFGGAVVYAAAMLAGPGGEQYATFFFHAVLLAGIIAVGTMIVSRQLLEKTRGLVYRGVRGEPPAATPENEQ